MEFRIPSLVGLYLHLHITCTAFTQQHHTPCTQEEHTSYHTHTAAITITYHATYHSRLTTASTITITITITNNNSYC
jgi:hypothetical protein